jgi:hypothetical protein
VFALQAELRKQEEEAALRQRLQAEIVEKLKADRAGQLEDRTTRRSRVRASAAHRPAACRLCRMQGLQDQGRRRLTAWASQL